MYFIANPRIYWYQCIQTSICPQTVPMLMPLRFRPQLIPTVATIAMIALTLWLGKWQWVRAEEKATLQSLLERRMKESPRLLRASDRDASDLHYRQFVARGTFIEEKQIFLDNKSLGDRAGYHVITPLQIEGTRTSVLVNLGWIARSPEYPAPPKVPVPSGRVEISGIATVPTARFLELSDANVEGHVWQNLTFERAHRNLGLDVLPVVLLARETLPELIPVQEAPNAGIDKHRGYAFQWFSIAAAILVVWLVVNTRTVRLRQ
jgi:surfeit locus 1 family protein